MRPPRVQPPSRRRRNLRESFDLRVRDEWKRYGGEPRRVLHRTLRERFLRAHLRDSGQLILELGPGPGRFTPILRRGARTRVFAVDLSRAGLRAGRRRAGRQPEGSRVEWIQAAGEHLPFVSRSIDIAVVLGNIVGFAGVDGPVLLKEIGRVVKPEGRLLADFASPAAATQEFFHAAANHRFLPRVLRRPRYYFLDRVLDTGLQPYAPARLARWEFRFYTAKEASTELARAGFRVVDAMSVAPVAAHQDRVAAIAHRERRTWEALLRIEERVGRRAGVLEAGDGFVVAAVRK
jgi:ubiquinone/menaquinone biosynthesis C-methylase UbiE